MSARIVADPTAANAYYHVFSRVAGGDFLFGDEEKKASANPSTNSCNSADCKP